MKKIAAILFVFLFILVGVFGVSVDVVAADGEANVYEQIIKEREQNVFMVAVALTSVAVGLPVISIVILLIVLLVRLAKKTALAEDFEKKYLKALSDLNIRDEESKRKILSLYIADVLMEIIENTTVGMLIKILDTTISEDEKGRKSLKELRYVLDEFTSESKLTGAALGALEAMTLKRFLTHIKRGSFKEI